MKKASLFRALALLAVAAALTSGAMSLQADGGPAGYAISWYRFGDISGVRMRNSQFRLEGTLGQMAAGRSANADFKLCSGVQCARTERVPPLRIYYFPMIKR